MTSKRGKQTAEPAEKADDPNTRGDATGPLAQVPVSRLPPYETLHTWIALTEKEQAFILAYARHRRKGRAAVEAGYSKKNAAHTGQRLLGKAEVRLCLQEIAERAAHSAEVNMTAHLLELAEIRDKAKAKGDFSPAVRAEELRGKTAGFYKDIVEFRPGGDLTDEELAQRIAAISGEEPERVKLRLVAKAKTA